MEDEDLIDRRPFNTLKIGSWLDPNLSHVDLQSSSGGVEKNGVLSESFF